MRKISLLLGLSLLGLTLAASPESYAGGGKAKGAASADAEASPKIEKSGIAEFDEVFMKAKDIHVALDAEHASLKTARKQINVALGIAEDAPLQTALDDLKTKANGKIKVALNGKTPKFEATEAVPENVQKGIEAFNKLTDAVTHAIDTAAGLAPQAKALVSTSAEFPAKLPKVAGNPMKAASASPTVTANVKAVGSTPDRIDALAKVSEGIFNDIKGAFPF